MNIKIIYSLLLALCLMSCNSLKDDFFYFIFGIDKISINRICSDNPSIFSEGRFIEIYSIPEADINNVVKSINSFSLDKKEHSKYSMYKTPVWKLTPVHENDSILSFVHRQMTEEKNSCFNESEIKTILSRERNYYLPLYDYLGRIRLFMLDTQSRKLFLITSYIL